MVNLWHTVLQTCNLFSHTRIDESESCGLGLTLAAWENVNLELWSRLVWRYWDNPNLSIVTSVDLSLDGVLFPVPLLCQNINRRVSSSTGTYIILPLSPLYIPKAYPRSPFWGRRGRTKSRTDIAGREAYAAVNQNSRIKLWISSIYSYLLSTRTCTKIYCYHGIQY